ncbi:sensor histidine kinase [Trinickia fusca]|uniref:histidine kinase n=1 Tax=Trinickia fusca TaxID=2419777 RepID=A0A494X0L4_9BURK|nr:HAMP domain-containing sensor histidine kinase [Trinickia fusca]RKP43870.1 sensor histidine kinase [Trinickia fusca]
MQQRGRDRLLRRLHWKLTLVWAAAWFVGVATIGTVALILHSRFADEAFASKQRLLAATVYGLTWFDPKGAFHDELLRKEPDVFVPGVDIWVIAPQRSKPVVLRPAHPVFDIASLPELAARVLADEQDTAIEATDSRGRRYALRVKVTYDNADKPVAVIFVIADPSVRDASRTRFARGLALAMTILAVLGLAGGNVLSRYLLRPVQRSFQTQERLLAAAAHELRAPVANLMAVSESARLGDVSPEEGLAKAERIAAHSAELVDKLLLMARLDATVETVEMKPLRLDLLVEAMLPEDGSVSLEAVESVVEADSRLVRIAVRNLLENALRHGSSRTKQKAGNPVRVTVRNAMVIVEDDGPGFSRDLLDRATEPFQKANDSSGTGLGLAIVQGIALLHGGGLRLENRRPSGARVTLALTPLSSDIS